MIIYISVYYGSQLMQLCNISACLCYSFLHLPCLLFWPTSVLFLFRNLAILNKIVPAIWVRFCSRFLARWRRVFCHHCPIACSEGIMLWVLPNQVNTGPEWIFWSPRSTALYFQFILLLNGGPADSPPTACSRMFGKDLESPSQCNVVKWRMHN